MGVLLIATTRTIPVGRWLAGHHRVEKGSDGEEIHVFAREEHSVYDEEDSNKKSFTAVIHLGPLTIKVIRDKCQCSYLRLLTAGLVDHNHR